MLDSSPRALIDLWPTLQAFADAIGVAYNTAKGMRRRNSIPSEYWHVGCDAAALKSIEGFTLEALARAHAKAALQEASA